MRRGKSKQVRETIHKYLTRQNKERQKKQNILADSDSAGETSTIATMANNEEDRDVTNAELRKLILGFEAKIDKKLIDGFADIKEQVSGLAEKIESVEVEVNTVKQAQKDSTEQLELMKSEISELRQSLLLSQAHSRKYNLLIYGLDGYESSPAATIERVRKFATDELKYTEEDAKRITFRNGHRLQKRSFGPTPIIVVFVHWTEREAFLRAGKHLAGKKLSIRTDLPPELKAKRGILARQAAEIRKDEKIHARIAERGIDIYLETRKDSSEPWKKRM